MIQAKDLRIGNYIKVAGVYEQIKQLHGEYCITNKHDSVSYKELQPISLTPEILERCGFIKISSINAYWFELTLGEMREYNFLTNDSNYSSTTWHIGIGGMEEDIWFEHVTTLHQLQNLIYIKIGTELSITL